MENRVTIYDIAKELGVSTATVNRALNDKPGVGDVMRKRVKETAKSMGFTVNHIAKSLARPPIHLCFIIYNHVPVFHDEITAGVRHEANNLKDFNVNFTIHALRGDAFAAHRDYIDCLQNMLAGQKPDGLLMMVSAQTNELYGYVQKMCEAGIKVALVSSDLPGSGRLFSCHQNAGLAGKMAAELLYRMVPTGKVAAFTGYKNVQDHFDSINGFQSECKRRGMEVIAICENHDDSNFAAYNAEQLFKQHPEIEGIYINTANSVSICNKLKEMGLAGKVRVVTSDIFQELVRFMREDVVQATIFQDPFRQGRTALKHLYRNIGDGVVPPADILIRPQVVLQSNLDEFMQFLNDDDDDK